MSRAGNKFYSIARNHQETTKLWWTRVGNFTSFVEDGGLAGKRREED